MPVHDWTRVDASLFHDFHQTWTINLRNSLNGGLLPKGFSALVEQHAGGVVPDVLALQRRPKPRRPIEPTGGAVVTAVPPKARHILRAEQEISAARGNRITIRYPGGLLATLFGRLTVVAGDGQLQVNRNGAFRSKEFKVSASSVTSIGAALSYTVMSGRQERRYYALHAMTRDGQRIPVGSGVKGEEVANAIAARIGKALKLAESHVHPASRHVKT